MGIKVQFIYPNTYGMNMLPPAIAIFSSLLKSNGHKIQVFDTTYYAVDFGIDADGTKMERLNVVPFNNQYARMNEPLTIEINSFDQVNGHPLLLLLCKKMVLMVDIIIIWSQY